MSDKKEENVSRHPVRGILGRLRGLRWTLGELATYAEKLGYWRGRWTMCFHLDGSLAGFVDRNVWNPGSDPLPTIQCYWTERRFRLVGAGLLPREQALVMDDGLELPEWEAQALEVGVVLPRLARPISTASDEWSELWHVSRQYLERWLSDEEEPASDEVTTALMSGAVEVREYTPPAIDGEMATAIVRASEAADELTSIHQLIGMLTEHVNEAGRLSQQLSANVLQALDGLDKPGWRARFRRDALMRAASWPRAEGGQLIDLPHTDAEAFQRIFGYHPCSFWREHAQTLQAWMVDLQAVVSEIGSPPDETSPRAPAGAGGLATEGEHDAPWSREMLKREDERVDGAVATASGIALNQTTDGPLSPDKWVHCGVSYSGLTPKPWRFLNHLWLARPRSVALQDLAMPVLSDHAQDVNEQKAGNWRRKANEFFRSNGIPLSVRIANRSAILEESSENRQTTEV